MGVSFKVSKTGRRFRPKPLSSHPGSGTNPTRTSEEDDGAIPKVRISAAIEDVMRSLSSKQIDAQRVLSTQNGPELVPSTNNDVELVCSEYEVSFTLNLLPDGFYIGKPSEMVNRPLQDAPKSLHPYDRTAQTLFSAIESGWLPGDILDDIPSTFYCGNLVCEIRDYRKCIPKQGCNGPTEDVPVIKKVVLQMSFENLVKDIPTISDDSWTYSDMLEFESRALKALKPQLCLETSPMLDRLSANCNPNKLDLAITIRNRKRALPPEAAAVFNNKLLGKQLCVNRVNENVKNESNEFRVVSSDADGRNTNQIPMSHASGPMQGGALKSFTQEVPVATLPSTSQSQFQQAPGSQRVNQDRFALDSASFNARQNMVNAYPEAAASQKRDSQDVLQSGIRKSARQMPLGQDINQQILGFHGEGPTGADMNWKHGLLTQQMVSKGIQYPTGVSGQRYFSPMMNDVPNQEAGGSFYMNQPPMKFGIKQEQVESGKLDIPEAMKFKNILPTTDTDNNPLDPLQLRSSQQLAQQTFMKQQWHNIGSLGDKDMRRKSAQSPRVSTGPPIQSPVPTKSGEVSTGSLNGQFGAAAATATSFGSLKEKSAAISNSGLGTGSVTSSPSDSMQRQPQSKRKTNSIPKAHPMSGVASPASVGNIATPHSASSPSVAASSMADPALLEKFSKIELLSQKYQLNVKKNKVEQFNVKKHMAPSKQEISLLCNSLMVEDLIDPLNPMSRSLFVGTMNNCRTRVLCHSWPNVYQGNMGATTVRNQHRLVMKEKPMDGVIIQYGDMEESNFPPQDSMITIPNTHYADLLGAQYRSLMEREGYQKIEDQTIVSSNVESGNPSFITGSPLENAATEVLKSEGIPGQQVHPAVVNGNNGNANHLSSSQNPSNSARLLPPGNAHALPSQGYLPSGANVPMSARPQQMDQTLMQQHSQQQQHLQQHQMQSQLQQQHQNPQMQQQAQPQQQQQQLQHSPMQRSSAMLQMNQLSQFIGQNTNMQIGGNHMMNKPTHLQLQALQQAHQQQQQQQQAQFSRKGMMGLGAMGMGNNAMGLGGLNNVLGVGGGRGISSPMASISGLNSMGTNQMNMGSATNFGMGVRASMTPAQYATLNLRMSQRGNMLGAQSGLAGLSGTSHPMLPSSMGMLTQSLGRPSMGALQRSGMTSMGPPKIPGSSMYLNAQQLQHQHLQQQQQQQPPQQQQQQQQQQQLQQQQLPQQQQQITSPLQQLQANSPSVIGSPQAVGMQQQISPQQMSQQIAMSPQQLSAGALQQMNNNNIAGPPASPQLSSQTHGSIGSITSSPMEHLQGANK